MEKTLQADVAEFKQRLSSHPLFESIESVEDIRLLCRYHIFAVWDFMSLLKNLQSQLTCMKSPWVPKSSPRLRYLINTLVLKEESDVGPDGQYASHYEMYRLCMKQMNADVSLIDNLMSLIKDEVPIYDAIEHSILPNPLKEFLEFTFWVVQKGAVHEQAAVLAYGREGFGQKLLLATIERSELRTAANLSYFRYYLRKKTELKESTHNELASVLLAELCGRDKGKWEEAKNAAAQALRIRLRLFDFINQKIRDDQA